MVHKRLRPDGFYYREGLYLPPHDLKAGYLYRLVARNARWGIWMGIERGYFLIRRYKFGQIFFCTETHYDLDPHYGTAQPLCEMKRCIYDNDFLSRYPGWENCNPNDVDNLLHWLGIEWIDPLHPQLQNCNPDPELEGKRVTKEDEISIDSRGFPGDD